LLSGMNLVKEQIGKVKESKKWRDNEFWMNFIFMYQFWFLDRI
jgi:tRNA(His) 5'-end guanylyltransferase